MDALYQKLVAAFQRPLPGEVAQFKLAHLVRQQFPAPPDDVRKAGVLALLYPDSSAGSTGARLIFIQRSSRDSRDRHAGQISFPGGSVEPEDKNLEATAVRETYEEIGVPITDIEVLGALTPLHIPVSNFLVFPFVGITRQRPQYILQAAEVDAVLEVSIDAFLHPDARTTMDKQLGNGIRLKDVPYWNVEGHQIWGATAMMTSELVEMIRE